MRHAYRRYATLAIAGLATALALTAPAAATPPGENGQIAFRRYVDADQTTSAIFSVRSNGSRERMLTHPAPGTLDTQPDWSPDVRLIGFERCAPGTVCANYTVRPDGTHLTRLTPACDAKPPAIETNCADESGIASMPDGRHVVFTRSTGRVREFPNGDGFIEHSDIVIRDLSGRHAHVVLRSSPFGGDNSQTVAAPDGTRLAFQRKNSPLSTPPEAPPSSSSASTADTCTASHRGPSRPAITPTGPRTDAGSCSAPTRAAAS